MNNKNTKEEALGSNTSEGFSYFLGDKQQYTYLSTPGVKKEKHQIWYSSSILRLFLTFLFCLASETIKIFIIFATVFKFIDLNCFTTIT